MQVRVPIFIYTFLLTRDFGDEVNSWWQIDVNISSTRGTFYCSLDFRSIFYSLTLWKITVGFFQTWEKLSVNHVAPFTLILLFPPVIDKFRGMEGGQGRRCGLQLLCFPPCGVASASTAQHHWKPSIGPHRLSQMAFFWYSVFWQLLTLLTTLFKTLPSLAGILTNLSARSIFWKAINAVCKIGRKY